MRFASLLLAGEADFFPDLTFDETLENHGVGCGQRTWIYMQLLAGQPDKFEICAAADPVPEYRDRLEKLSNNPDLKSFPDADAFFEAGKIADVLIIGTQDNYHFGPCKKALELGYDIVLEKPIAQTLTEVLELERLARKLNRKVLVCHVYRFAPLFAKMKDLLSSAVIGDVISVNAIEGVEPWHQGHSFVRGHWAVTEKSNPMILAKCCHDLDLLSWMVGADCRAVSSFGSTSYFNARKAPACAPLRCTDGCAIAEPANTPPCGIWTTRNPRGWHRCFPTADSATDREITDWLKVSPWGRCVYHCDNDTVDHQTLNLEFENDVTCTLTMTAFESGRHWDIYGTLGKLSLHNIRDDNPNLEIVVKEHHTGKITVYPIVAPEGGSRFHHEGGDVGLAEALYEQMTLPEGVQPHSSITQSLQSHLMAFGAEESRRQASMVNLSDLSIQYSL